MFLFKNCCSTHQARTHYLPLSEDVWNDYHTHEIKANAWKQIQDNCLEYLSNFDAGDHALPERHWKELKEVEASQTNLWGKIGGFLIATLPATAAGSAVFFPSHISACAFGSCCSGTGNGGDYLAAICLNAQSSKAGDKKQDLLRDIERIFRNLAYRLVDLYTIASNKPKEESQQELEKIHILARKINEKFPLIIQSSRSANISSSEVSEVLSDLKGIVLHIAKNNDSQEILDPLLSNQLDTLMTKHKLQEQMRLLQEQVRQNKELRQEFHDLKRDFEEFKAETLKQKERKHN
jgi:ATP-dependent Lon protease